MIGFLANTFGKWQLNKRFSKMNREVEALNLSQVKKAIIVFHLTDEIKYSEIIKIYTQLKRDEGISELELLAYSPYKEIPSYVDDQQIIIFGKNEVNIAGLPKLDFAMELLRERFDLLIDFTPDSFLPTDYFLALLDAKTKVGRANTEKDYILDLMIETHNNTGFLDLSKNIIRYLKMINKA